MDDRIEEEEVRVSVSIPKSLNDKLNNYLPYGVKAAVVRQLLKTLLASQMDDPHGYIVQDLLHDKVRLRKIDN